MYACVLRSVRTAVEKKMRELMFEEKIMPKTDPTLKGMQ